MSPPASRAADPFSAAFHGFSFTPRNFHSTVPPQRIKSHRRLKESTGALRRFTAGPDESTWERAQTTTKLKRANQDTTIALSDSTSFLPSIFVIFFFSIVPLLLGLAILSFKSKPKAKEDHHKSSNSNINLVQRLPSSFVGCLTFRYITKHPSTSTTTATTPLPLLIPGLHWINRNLKIQPLTHHPLLVLH